MRVAIHITILLTFIFTTAANGAQNKPPKKTLSPARLKQLSTSVFSDDSFERINAVVELTNYGEQAKGALPYIKRAMKRERNPKILSLMLTALRTIETGSGDTGPQPKATDIPAISGRLVVLINQLNAKDAAAQRRAITQLRQLAALAHPALGHLNTLAADSKDKTTKSVADSTGRTIRTNLWFLSPADRVKTATQKSSEKPDQKSIEAELKKLVGKLISKLNDRAAATTLKAMRQLMTMGAAAAPAMGKLQKMALNAKDSKQRRAAAIAIKKITPAINANTAWYKSRKDRTPTPKTPEHTPKNTNRK